MNIIREKINVFDMTCTSCENRVEKAIKKLTGVVNVKASFSGQYVIVEYDTTQCNLYKIKATIKSVGYSLESSNNLKFIGIIVIVAAILLLGLKTSGFDMEAKLTSASYAVLFIVGVLTSIHCVGMCGGIMLSQSLSKESKNKFEAIEPALFYNLGRVVSYTILGGVIGALGSVFSLSVTTKSILQIFAGIFMIIMGLNMSGFNAFRKFNIKLPYSACKVKNKPRTPFLVGLINGLMPCGPLQTMQLFALGTGSATKGALSMFMFSIGTVPLMLTFGAVSGLLSKGYTKKILKFSGVLIIVLGLIMGNRGLALSGININPLTAITKIAGLENGSSSNSSSTSNSANSNSAKATIKDGVQTLIMTADNRGYTPNVLYVQKGIPVKWVIDGKQLNSCNNAIVAQSLNIQKKLKSGENIIEFTPNGKDINFSCWMGMIRGTIRVVDNLDTVKSNSNNNNSENSVTTKNTSIYGDDITKVKTETLINKASVEKDYNSASFKGIGYELKPLVFVTDKTLKTKVTFDLNEFDDAEGEFSIVNIENGDKITSFTGKKGLNQLDFNQQTPGGYAIVKDNGIIGVIEVVANVNTINLESIRQKYFK